MHFGLSRRSLDRGSSDVVHKIIFLSLDGQSRRWSSSRRVGGELVLEAVLGREARVAGLRAAADEIEAIVSSRHERSSGSKTDGVERNRVGRS